MHLILSCVCAAFGKNKKQRKCHCTVTPNKPTTCEQPSSKRLLDFASNNKQ